MSASHILLQLDRKMEAAARDMHAAMWLANAYAECYSRPGAPVTFAFSADDVSRMLDAISELGVIQRRFRTNFHPYLPAESKNL